MWEFIYRSFSEWVFGKFRLPNNLSRIRSVDQSPNRYLIFFQTHIFRRNTSSLSVYDRTNLIAVLRCRFRRSRPSRCTHYVRGSSLAALWRKPSFLEMIAKQPSYRYFFPWALSMDITSTVVLNYNSQNQQNPRTAFTNGEHIQRLGTRYHQAWRVTKKFRMHQSTKS
jgi:hypothetical protein